VHTALLNVARVQPGTSEGITDLLLPQPSSGLRKVYSQQSPEFIHIPTALAKECGSVNVEIG